MTEQGNVSVKLSLDTTEFDKKYKEAKEKLQEVIEAAKSLKIVMND